MQYNMLWNVFKIARIGQIVSKKKYCTRLSKVKCQDVSGCLSLLSFILYCRCKYYKASRFFFSLLLFFSLQIRHLATLSLVISIGMAPGRIRYNVIKMFTSSAVCIDCIYTKYLDYIFLNYDILVNIRPNSTLSILNLVNQCITYQSTTDKLKNNL